MPRLPRTSGERIVNALERLGFARERQRGSHIVMARLDAAGRRRVCVVPLHDEVAVGTLRSVLRQAGVSPAEILDVI
jgi:predicted RNA binding protein YcfA (HicA-like mRNA interferase family)